MKKIKELIAVVIFLLGIAAVINASSPETGKKIKDVFLNTFFKEEGGEKVQEVFEKRSGSRKNILGEEAEGNETLQEEIVEEIITLPKKIISQEVVTEVTEKINKVIIETVEEAKEIPQKATEAVKEEIRKQMYKEICEDWLKE